MEENYTKIGKKNGLTYDKDGVIIVLKHAVTPPMVKYQTEETVRKAIETYNQDKPKEVQTNFAELKELL